MSDDIISDDLGLGPIRVGPFEFSSQNKGEAPPVIVRYEPASNGDSGCVDIIVEQDGIELERYKNRAKDVEHHSVSQRERDAVKREIRELEEDA